MKRDASSPSSDPWGKWLVVALATAYLIAFGIAAVLMVRSPAPWWQIIGGLLLLAAITIPLYVLAISAMAGLVGEIGDVFRFGLARTEPPRWLARAPFQSKLLIVLYGAAFLPIAFSIECALERQRTCSVVLAAVWGAAFPLLAMVFHRRCLMHLGISVFAAVVAIAGLAFAWLVRD